MVGQPEALARALGEVTRLVRANPPKEKPGGPPPSLAAITGARHLHVMHKKNDSCLAASPASRLSLNHCGFLAAGVAAGPQAGGLAQSSRHHAGHAGGHPMIGGNSGTVVIKARVSSTMHVLLMVTQHISRGSTTAGRQWQMCC